MKIKTLQKNSGFTLVESLFSIMILTFTIAGLMTILSNSLFSARYSKDEITANYLLQEVVDYVRNDRDATVFLGSNWSSFTSHYSNCLEINGGCYFNVNDTSIDKIKSCKSTDDGLCPPLYFDEKATRGSFYNYDETNLDNEKNTRTNFIRKIIVSGSGDEFIVTATVYWKNGSSDLQRSLSTSLMNWKK